MLPNNLVFYDRNQNTGGLGIIDLGGVSSKDGVQQTVMFTIPGEEPETKFIPIEKIDITYVGVGTATITVSITNKDEATHGGPFTDTIAVEVVEAAGEFVAFLNSDEGGSNIKGMTYGDGSQILIALILASMTACATIMLMSRRKNEI